MREYSDLWTRVAWCLAWKGVEAFDKIADEIVRDIEAARLDGKPIPEDSYQVHLFLATLEHLDAIERGKKPS